MKRRGFEIIYLCYLMFCCRDIKSKIMWRRNRYCVGPCKNLYKHRKFIHCENDVWWSGNTKRFFVILYSNRYVLRIVRGCRGSDRMLVGFTTTCAISAYHHSCCEFKSQSGRGVHYVIKFVSDLRQVGAFLRVVRFTSRIKLTAAITEIFLKIALYAIKQTTIISIG